MTWQLEDKLFGNPAVSPGERAPFALEKWLREDFQAYPTGDEADLRTLPAWFGELLTVKDDLADLEASLPGLYQPLDADLTAIAAIATTTYGRAFLALADQAALVALLPSYQPLDSDLTAIAALTTTAYGRAFLALADQAALVALLPAYQPLDSDLTTIAGLTATTDNFIGSVASAWASRTPAQVLATLAAVGTTFQPLDSDLTAIAALTTTTYGRAFLTLADGAALQALLDSDLQTIAGLTPTTDNFMIAASSAWASRTPAQARASLNIVTGTYTPTLTNTTNVAASTSLACMYIQINDMVYVSGSLVVDPTAAAPTVTLLGVSLPVASNFGSAIQAAGLMADNGTESGIVEADSANDRLSVRWQATDSSNHNIRFSAIYRVI